MNRPTVYIRAFGCQMNKLDAELVLGRLQQAGYARTENVDAADVILYLTCSVREHAESRAYSIVGKLKFLKRRRPEVVIGILGCMAQKDREKIFARLPHVNIICGTREFPRIAELVSEARNRNHVIACNEEPLNVVARNVHSRANKFQAYVSIMRGCDNFCSYCIVPSVRGREISRAPDEVRDEVSRLVDDGVREICLLGQNVNTYGRSFGRKAALADMLCDLGNINGLKRLRFVTSHPRDMARPILEAMREAPAVCEYLHMPAQSGSDRILKLMNRRITNAHYRELVAEAREIVPGIAIASDFIVGFPGETRAEFEETASLVRDMRFQNSFVFKYSPRSGTRAAELADTVSWEEKKRRNVELLEIQKAISLEEHNALLGQSLKVLVEGPSKRDPARLTSRTRANHIVVFPAEPSLAGEIIHVRATQTTALTIAGEVV